MAGAGVQREHHSRASRHQGLAHQLVMRSTWTHELHVDTISTRTHKLHVDRGAPCGHTSSTWTQALHGHTISTRSHKLHVDTPPCSAWTHKLHVGRRASHGHTSFTWTHELCVDTSPCSTWLPLPLHLPGMPLPGSNTLSAGHPPDTWCRQAHGMVWGGHRKQ